MTIRTDLDGRRTVTKADGTVVEWTKLAECREGSDVR